MYPGLAEEKLSTAETMILGFAPVKGGMEGFEMAGGSENGCKCGSNCTCDPCTCK
ncbi:Metallothionein-like protein type 2, partial [Trichinella patagoniensis]